MKAIFKKDFLSLFRNVTGWIYLAVNIIFYGIYFVSNNLLAGNPSISQTVSALTLISLISTPLLTMRSIPEEKRNRTDVLLMSSPVSSKKIVLGKFFAMAAVLTIFTGIIALSPVFLRIFGNVSFRESYVTLLGYWLFSLAAVSVGMFLSSFTESQVIASIIAEGVLILGYVMPNLTNSLNFPTVLSKILGCYDLSSPFDKFMSGIIYVKSIVYYLSLIFLMLFLTTEVIEKKRWTVSVKRIRTQAFSISAIVVALAIVIGGNIGVTLIPEAYQSFDFTKSKMYSLTGETKKYIKDMKSDINIYCMAASSKKLDNTVAHTLKLFDTSSKIKVKYIDSTKNPTFASKYSNDSLDSGSLIVENKKTNRFKIIPYYKLFYNQSSAATISQEASQYGMNYSDVYLQTASGFDAEGKIMSALQYVNNKSNPVIYTLSGHEEADLGQAFLDILDKMNIETKSLSLRTENIPDKAELIIVCGPKKDLSTDETEKLSKFIENGGKIIFALNPDGETAENGLPNYDSLLSKYGIKVEKSLVCENDDSNHLSGNNYMLFPNLDSSDYTKGIESSPSVIIPFAVVYSHEESDNISDFLTTSDKASAASVSDATSGNVTSDSGKEYPVATAITTGKSKNANVFVLASAYMFLDNMEQYAPGMNTAMFKNILNTTLSHAEKNSITIKPKKYSADTLTFSQRQVRLFTLLWIGIIPVCLLAAGIVIWVRRRRA